MNEFRGHSMLYLCVKNLLDLCRINISKGRVLKMNGPSAQGFLSLTGPLAPRVADCPSGNAYEVSVTGLAFCVICDTISSATYFLVSPWGGKGTGFVRERSDLKIQWHASHRGEVPRSGKGCTGQSTDRMLHRGPDRQSAAPRAKRRENVMSRFPFRAIRHRIRIS